MPIMCKTIRINNSITEAYYKLNIYEDVFNPAIYYLSNESQILPLFKFHQHLQAEDLIRQDEIPGN